METFQEHYLSMKRTIAARKLNVDMALIDRAVDYAREKHKDQKRKDGSPYIIHPLAVAEIVAEIGLDTDAILGALLHDCIEDTDSTYDDIARNFGPTVASLVEGVTKLTRVEYSTLEEQQMENLRKMFMAMSKDIRVILIKIADRLHNTRTMQYQSPAKQISKSRETMDIYAPLAHRLGMQKIKWELEDTSLKYLDPEGYNEIMRYLNAHQAEADAFMKAIQSKITTRLSAVGIHGSIYGRIKHVYSIYRKMKAQNKTIDELYDMYAFRVIVDSIPDCYNVLGHIHDLFNLVPGRFKDYISTPKPNMYQSLHTTVIGQQGIPFEVQIRTWEMHETAEYGIAAHWKYKQGVAGGDEKQFEWVRRLLETQQDSDAEDYIHSLKVDMFDDEVFVFTPKGKVMSLPSGSTPIDFAYAIHSGVGNAMVGAKVNNRIASYDQQLCNGDIVEDIDSCMIKFSRCCTPVPGDDIVGFITKGYGVSIHRRDCRNASGASDPKQAGRWVKVAWSTEDKPFSTTFEIDSTDRSGIWLDIATALSAAKLKVTELSGRDMPAGKARTVATFEVRNVQELETIRTKIRAIDGVIDVRRGQN